MGLPSVLWLHTGKGPHASWCKCWFTGNDMEMSTSGDDVGSIYCYFTEKETKHSHIIFRWQDHTVFQWFRLKPCSCYPPHRTLHMLDKLFVWWLFTPAVFLFVLINSNQTRKGKNRGQNKTRRIAANCQLTWKSVPPIFVFEQNKSEVLHKQRFHNTGGVC